MAAQADFNLFRAYDIRGVVSDQSLNPDLAYDIGLAIGSEAQDLDERKIIVGRDGRVSSPTMSKALISGICASGCDVVEIGLVPTPVVYFATHFLKIHSGVMVTASHNPANHNGFKIVLAGKTLNTGAIYNLYDRICKKKFRSGFGKISQQEIISDYISYIVQNIYLDRALKIVVDCGNGVASCVAPQLYRSLGCEVVELFCVVDGRFPNHHPDPTVPENLQYLIEAVKKNNADCGLAFDGDADRIGVVTEKGQIIWPDRQMILFSRDVLEHCPGATIVFDVKCTNLLPKMIKQWGGKPVMYRTGHSILKEKMLEINAPLAGEMSGHIFFNDEWFGFDDGLYVGARLLRILSQTNKSCNELFSELPDSVNTPELKLPMAEEKKADFMGRFIREADFAGAELITIDGLRVEFDFGWGLVRASNTSPYLILRFEADSPQHLKWIKEKFRQELLKIDSHLLLPY